jgi:uncharacterized protein YjdB
LYLINPCHGSKQECTPDKGEAFCFDHRVMNVKGNEIKTKKGEKQMNKKISVGLGMLLIVALIIVPGASATPSYAKATGASCGTCHIDPAGGGSLTAVGQIYRQTGSLQAPTTVLTPGTQEVTTITVSPSTTSLEVNGTQTFTATAIDQIDHIISAIFTWVSSNPTVGTIDASGKFTALSAGTTTITATNGTISGSAIASVGTLPISDKREHEQEDNEQQAEQEHTNTHEHVNTQEHTSIKEHEGTTDKNNEN